MEQPDEDDRCVSESVQGTTGMKTAGLLSAAIVMAGLMPFASAQSYTPGEAIDQDFASYCETAPCQSLRRLSRASA